MVFFALLWNGCDVPAPRESTLPTLVQLPTDEWDAHTLLRVSFPRPQAMNGFRIALNASSFPRFLLQAADPGAAAWAAAGAPRVRRVREGPRFLDAPAAAAAVRHD